ncbi:MAG: hypothetical protein F4Y99_10950 [Acidimicrobiaceae bacterium]|nr:hypothetical protein [Acidimicrobiaceae bacterium]MYF41788.1 hypothetical protein [Acidimicrobiaceae bacterium]
MFKLALRSLIDKKLRFALTTLVVVIGVMFVVGSFTLTDSLRATFGGLAEDIAQRRRPHGACGQPVSSREPA